MIEVETDGHLYVAEGAEIGAHDLKSMFWDEPPQVLHLLNVSSIDGVPVPVHGGTKTVELPKRFRVEPIEEGE